MSYDTKCLELAEAFLGDTDLDVKKLAPGLAQEIQDVIQDFIQAAEDGPMHLRTGG